MFSGSGDGKIGDTGLGAVRDDGDGTGEQHAAAHLPDVPVQVRRIQTFGPRVGDLGVQRTFVALARTNQVFVELLSVAQTGDHDFHVLTAGHGPQPFGDIQDPDGFAHVQDEDLSPLAMAPAWITSWQASGMVMK